jgi:hypothetical protein
MRTLLVFVMLAVSLSFAQRALISCRFHQRQLILARLRLIFAPAKVC